MSTTPVVSSLCSASNSDYSARCDPWAARPPTTPANRIIGSLNEPSTPNDLDFLDSPSFQRFMADMESDSPSATASDAWHAFDAALPILESPTPPRPATTPSMDMDLFNLGDDTLPPDFQDLTPSFLLDRTLLHLQDTEQEWLLAQSPLRTLSIRTTSCMAEEQAESAASPASFSFAPAVTQPPPRDSPPRATPTLTIPAQASTMWHTAGSVGSSSDTPNAQELRITLGTPVRTKSAATAPASPSTPTDTLRSAVSKEGTRLYAMMLQHLQQQAPTSPSSPTAAVGEGSLDAWLQAIGMHGVPDAVHAQLQHMWVAAGQLARVGRLLHVECRGDPVQALTLLEKRLHDMVQRTEHLERENQALRAAAGSAPATMVSNVAAPTPSAAPAPSPARAVLKAGHVKQITNLFQNMAVADVHGAARPKSRLCHGSGVAADKENVRVVVEEDECDSPLLGRWDDEVEYDAVTETLHAKHIYVVACQPGDPDPEALVTIIRDRLANVALQTAFASPRVLPAAQAVWQGRSVPPHFFKLRTRDTLDDGSRIGAFVLELLQQNWKTELDYGLGGVTQASESLLVVTPAAPQLLAAATGDASIRTAPLLAMLETRGALVDPEEHGAALTLDALRSLLQPTLCTVDANVTLS